MTFILLLTATALIACAAAFAAYWLTVFILRRKRPVYDAADATWTTASFSRPFLFACWDNDTGQWASGGDFTVTMGSFKVEPSDPYDWQSETDDPVPGRSNDDPTTN